MRCPVARALDVIGERSALLTAGTYGLAEHLAYTLTQPQTFGTLIPAIGATPYALCGAIYPIAALPVGVRQFAPDASIRIEPGVLIGLASGRTEPSRAWEQIEIDGDRQVARDVIDMLTGSVR